MVERTHFLMGGRAYSFSGSPGKGLLLTSLSRSSLSDWGAAMVVRGSSSWGFLGAPATQPTDKAMLPPTEALALASPTHCLVP